MQYAHTDQKLEAIGQRIAKDININHGYYGREIYTRDRVIFYNLEKAVYLAVINDDRGGNSRLGNIFSINEDDMNVISSRLKKVHVDIEDMVNSMSKSFQGLNQSGLFDTSPLQKVISFINSCVESSQNKLNILSNSVFGGEMDMYHRIQEIEEPQDFVKNNSITIIRK